MKIVTALAAGLILAAPAFAQDNPNDPAERQLQMLRLALQLNEEQVGKAREILKKQNDEIRGLLTDDQKRRYDDMFRLLGRFGGGGGGNDPGGGFRGFGGSRGGSWYPSTDDLKAQLSLTDEQASKINELRDAVRQEMRNFWQGRTPGANTGEEWQAYLQKLREDTTKKIREVIPEEQKAKFDEVLKNYQDGQQGNAPDGGRRRGGSSIDDRVARAMENLKIEDAREAEAIKGLVKRVIELMEKLDSQQRDARNKIEETLRNRELSEEAVGDKIDEIRKGLRQAETELSTARKELAEVVTNRQELELIRRGILR